MKAAVSQRKVDFSTKFEHDSGESYRSLSASLSMMTAWYTEEKETLESEFFLLFNKYLLSDRPIRKY